MQMIERKDRYSYPILRYSLCLFLSFFFFFFLYLLQVEERLQVDSSRKAASQDQDGRMVCLEDEVPAAENNS